MPNKQKHNIIEDVLMTLQIDHIAGSVVGSPENRGISGGQKKRVNIGMELVAYPKILFLDEPTSGLDSAAASMTANCLKKMTDLGINIVCVIHQPRYSVFTTFTHVLLLAPGGKQVYLGSTNTIHEYFIRLGFEFKTGENVADWIIDVVSGCCPRLKNGKQD